jgi:hypothetical protein
VSKTGSWVTKSLLIGLGAGLAVFVLSYGFLMIHQEVGVHPSVSYTPALLAFAVTTVAALVYFRLRTGR